MTAQIATEARTAAVVRLPVSGDSRMPNMPVAPSTRLCDRDALRRLDVALQDAMAAAAILSRESREHVFGTSGALLDAWLELTRQCARKTP